MKLPNFFNNKKKIFAAGLLVFIVVGTVGGGIFLSRKEKNNEVLPENRNEATTADQTVDTDSVSRKKYPSENPDTAVSNDNTKAGDDLSDVTIQGALMPDNNIKTTLFGSKGVYLVEKRNTENKWLTVAEDISISSENGYDLNDLIPVSETERVYRVFEIKDNLKIGPKEILVDRNLLVSKGGETNFPGAL